MFLPTSYKPHMACKTNNGGGDNCRDGMKWNVCLVEIHLYIQLLTRLTNIVK